MPEKEENPAMPCQHITIKETKKGGRCCECGAIIFPKLTKR